MTAPEIGSQLSLGAVFGHRGPQNDPRRHYMHIHVTAIGDYTDRLIREEDGSLFAYRCRGCGCAWKIYQQETHYAGCVHRPVDPPTKED